MEPVTPVLPHSQPLELRVAEHQPEFLTLPSFCTTYTNISRWRLTDEERAYIAAGGDLFLAQITGGGGVQPIMPMAMDEGEILAQVLACEEELGLK